MTPLQQMKQSIYDKKYGDKNRAGMKARYHANKEIYLAKSRTWFEANPEKRLLQKARANAKERNLEFNLELSDIIIPKNCPLLGVPLTFILGAGHKDFNVSIDRIDNTKGYIKGNIQIMSNLANRMKRNASKEQLINFAKGILDYYEFAFSNLKSFSNKRDISEV